MANKGSFDAVGSWLSKARSRRPPGSPPLPGVLVANKVDLRSPEADGDGPMTHSAKLRSQAGGGASASRAVVTQAMGYDLAQKEGLEYFETSAAAQQGNLDPFHFIADQFHRRYAETSEALGGM